MLKYIYKVFVNIYIFQCLCIYDSNTNQIYKIQMTYCWGVSGVCIIDTLIFDSAIAENYINVVIRNNFLTIMM